MINLTSSETNKGVFTSFAKLIRHFDPKSTTTCFPLRVRATIPYIRSTKLARDGDFFSSEEDDEDDNDEEDNDEPESGRKQGPSKVAIAVTARQACFNTCDLRSVN